MKLKNNALQILYDTLVNAPLIVTIYDIDNAFQKCDIALTSLEKANADRTELQKDRDYYYGLYDYYYGLYTELRKDYDKLFEENKKLKVRTDCHRNEVMWYRKHYKEQSDKIKELKFRLNSMCGDEYIKKLQDGVREIGYEQGQTDLWHKLQNVKDAKPWDISSFYPDVSCMDDVLSWDLEDFLDAYKKWQEEKVRSCRLYSGSIDISGKISEVNEVPVSCDIPIKDLASWECTLEATVEVDKDLLEKVCGVKPDEEKHQLKYGDAVRLPWRDYDYMYIESTEKGPNVRLFDPKNHAVVVTHILNAKYNGGKIILTSEEDLRKIWKDTK